MSEQTDEPFTLIMCGTKDDCDHKWDGPEIDIGNGSSASCSKCGMSAYTHSVRTAE